MPRKYFKDAKTDANKQGFKIELNLTCQAESNSKQ